MKGHVLWVYGVITKGEEVWPDVHDVEGGGNFLWVPAAGLSALASPVEAQDYQDKVIQDHQDDTSWILPRATASAAAVASVFAHTAIIPLKFATIFSNPESLQERLATQQTVFHQTLEDIRNKEEWGIKIFGHIETCINRLAEQQLARVAEKNLSSGRQYLLKKHITQSCQPQAERQMRQAADAWHQVLLNHADAFQLGNPAQETRLEDGSIPLFKASYLIFRQDREKFLRLLMNLEQQENPADLKLQISGPWAPYSFCHTLFASGK